MAINWDLSSHFVSSEWGKTSFVFGGVSYEGLKTKLDAERKATVAGYLDDYKFSLLVKSSTLQSQPVPMSTKVSCEGKTYLCVGTELDSAGVMLRLDLGETP